MAVSNDGGKEWASDEATRPGPPRKTTTTIHKDNGDRYELKRRVSRLGSGKRMFLFFSFILFTYDINI